MKDRQESTAPIANLSTLEFDPETVLLKEPSMLLHGNFLAALHAELEAELGDDEAQTTLLQIGFLHGLQDAVRIVGHAFGLGRPAAAGEPTCPPLAIRLGAQQRGECPGAFDLEGWWPEQSEASARLSALGPCADPACFLSAGYTSGWLSGIFDADLLALETTCSAGGAKFCRFRAQEADAWRRSGDRRAATLLDALPFESFRRFVEERAEAPLAQRTALDGDGSTVHIWGPVMVVPFSAPHEAMRAVELIATDPAAGEVSVVVVDLANTIVDETYGAVALERIVEMAESWGAEAIFAEVSPLCQEVVASLDRQPVMVHKDLHQAIAAAFQIARSQRVLS